MCDSFGSWVAGPSKEHNNTLLQTGRAEPFWLYSMTLNHLSYTILTEPFPLTQWVSAFLMLQPFSTVPQVVLLLTVMNHHVNASGDRGLPKGS